MVYYEIGTTFILKKRFYAIIEINKNNDTYKLLCIEDCSEIGKEIIVKASNFSAEPCHILIPNGIIFEEDGIVSIKQNTNSQDHQILNKKV